MRNAGPLIDPYKNSVAMFKLRFKVGRRAAVLYICVPPGITTVFYLPLASWICANTPIKLLLSTEPTTSFPLWLPHDHPNVESPLLSPVQKAMHSRGRALTLYPEILLCLATELLESYRKSGCRKCTFVLAVCEIIRPIRCIRKETLRNT